ncbi:hypothetical protein [Spongiactinospora sp. TRM90649]|uniref:hypothetical protein n=1 Tax=Spongiactinospora sp. TRM90649 TaxID=3031114 RepID=UPI0023F6EC62|nr:hypothetical protein [Spongiactinospora sp. TRM90649]MDF5757555.1 hypothetical protein [Spongiactinospora sp. TRM90649]
MARTPAWRDHGPTITVWPPDRFEVRCDFPPPDFTVADRYHYAEFAYEAARRHREVGWAQAVQVVRLSDGGVVFDLASAHELPLDTW